MQFDSLNLIEPILRSIKEEGYVTPTPIQEQAIPVVLQGNDLLGSAQTGTGKTAAFAIPILQMLSNGHVNVKKRKIRSLIVTPTRELAIQIEESFKAYGRYTDLSSTVIFGGVNQGPQTSKLQKGVDILIATPGRLLDLMSQGYISLSDVKMFVLDEADRMLDMGFIHDVKRIIAALPAKRQSLFFSATMPPEIVKLSRTILNNNPVKVEIVPVKSTAELISQYIYFVEKGNKNALLIQILRSEEEKNALVFTRTKHGADKIVKILSKNNITAEAIHSNKGQSARQRALSNFKAGSTRVLVATDIASRGIDVDDLDFVINYEIPNIAETYVHRIGRTGRAGARGIAVSFCDTEERSYLRDIEKLINKKIDVVKDHPYVSDLVEVPAQKNEAKKGTSGRNKQRPSQKDRKRQKQWNTNSRMTSGTVR